MVLYSSITLKRARPSTANIKWRYWSVYTMKSRKKRPHLKKKKVLLNQDNAPVHKSIKKTAKLH
jgi:hypothetical protein